MCDFPFVALPLLPFYVVFFFQVLPIPYHALPRNVLYVACLFILVSSHACPSMHCPRPAILFCSLCMCLSCPCSAKPFPSSFSLCHIIFVCSCHVHVLTCCFFVFSRYGMSCRFCLVHFHCVHCHCIVLTSFLFVFPLLVLCHCICLLGLSVSYLPFLVLFMSFQSIVLYMACLYHASHCSVHILVVPVHCMSALAFSVIFANVILCVVVLM